MKPFNISHKNKIDNIWNKDDNIHKNKAHQSGQSGKLIFKNITLNFEEVWKEIAEFFANNIVPNRFIHHLWYQIHCLNQIKIIIKSKNKN